MLLIASLFALWTTGFATAAARRPRDATVEGYVQVCGGPAPGPCLIKVLKICQVPEPCLTTTRVAVIDVHGRRVAEQRLRHARFSMRLRSGTYTVELLGDGNKIHGRVMQRKKITARAHHTAVVRFMFAVP